MPTWTEIWHRAVVVFITPTQPLPWWATSLVLAAAVAAVALPRVWPISRNVVTIAHEGGHAIVAALTGRRLNGVRLHSDTSGVTVSSGKPTGLGMVATALGGYIAPSLLGLALAASMGASRAGAAIMVLLVALLSLLALIRNLWGLLAVGVSLLVTAAVAWWGSALVFSLFVSVLSWFLLAAGPRPVWELHLKRRAGEAPDSDADQLARLTGVGGSAWVVVFALVCAGCLFYGGKWVIVG